MPAPGDALIEGLATRGHAIERDALPGDVVAGLRDRARSLDRAGAFAPAGVGRAGARSQRSDVRGDRIAWLDDASDDRRSAPSPTGSRRCALRCNRDLMLGLAEHRSALRDVPARRALRASSRSFSRRRRARAVVRALSQRRRGPRRRRRASPVHSRQARSTSLPLARHVRRVPVRRLRARGAAGARERLALAGWFRRRVLV